MAVKKEYACKAHGYFESYDKNPRCPLGCNTITQVFTQPPGGRSAKTRFTDHMMNRMSASRGLTDMANSDGGSVMENLRKRNWASNPLPAFFGKVDQGGTYDVEKHKASKDTGGALQSLATMGAPQDNAMSDVGNLPMPKPKLMAPDYKG